jgi:hypothetical protein
VTVEKLNKAIADVVNAFMELDLIRVWGDGSVVAADGTQVDTFTGNLLAETSIRYGGTGGIGYYYIPDTYIALFSRFIPVGVWEAVYLIQGLVDHTRGPGARSPGASTLPTSRSSPTGSWPSWTACGSWPPQPSFRCRSRAAAAPGARR